MANNTSQFEIASKRRAFRFVPVPSGKIINITERDLIWAEQLQSGSAGISHLHEFTKHMNGCTASNRAQDRLTDLFHETRSIFYNGENIGGGFFTRDPEQANTFDARHQEATYDLTDHAKKVLRKAGREWSVGCNYGGRYGHRFFCSSVYKGIQLSVLNDPTLRFIHQHEIMQKAQLKSLAAVVEFNHPITKEVVKVPHGLSGRMVVPRLIPDMICGLERTNSNGAKSYLMLLIEADRANGGVRRLDFRGKGFLKNFLQYRQFIASGQYREFFKASKVPALVLYATASGEARIQTMLDTIMEFSPKGCPFMLIQHVDGFGAYVKPQPPMKNLFDGSWQRAGYEAYNISQMI